MMRWNYTETASVSETGSTDDERSFAQSPTQHLLDAVASVLALLGPRSAMVVVLVAFAFAALILGLSADDAVASSRWCLKCM